MTTKNNPWTARLDLLQSVSGLLLLLFVWGHMFFESSILLGKDAMFWVTRMFEGEWVLGRSYPVLVSVAAGVVLALVALHAILALRKFPGDYGQYRALHRHMAHMRHGDTTLWYVQVITGFAMFFLAPVHLYVMLVQPDNIGPYASSDRVWSDRFWLLYLLLLVTVHLHAGVGFYRLAMKWGWFSAAHPARSRRRLKLAMWCIIGFYLSLGSASLVTYMKLGMDHADRAGERYLPANYRGADD